MIHRKTTAGPRPAAVLAAAMVCAATVSMGCNDTDKLRVIGDTCVRDDECQAGRCDELRCVPEKPAEVGEPCENRYWFRSKACGVSFDDTNVCMRGPRPPKADCTADDQCAVGFCVDGTCAEGTDGGVRDGDAAADSGLNPDVGGVVLPATWVTIPPTGSPPFKIWMGAGTGDTCAQGNEDCHEVTLTHRFEIQSTEVTQAQYEALMGFNPSYFGPNGNGADCGGAGPVEEVNWHQAALYCNRLSARAGYASCYECRQPPGELFCEEASPCSGQQIYTCPGYRLPTEAEWEYAYRAGSTTGIYPSATQDGTLSECGSGLDVNLDKIGWYTANSGGKTHPVGQKEANAWGLYDMAGNVREWCHDGYEASLGTAAVTDPWGSASTASRVVRGGAWYNIANYLRAARRHIYNSFTRNFYHGWRAARTLLP